MPATLSDPLMKVGFDLVEDKNGNLSITRTEEDNNSGGPRRAHERCEGILQGMFCVQAISFSVYEQRSNCPLPRRLSTNRHPCTYKRAIQPGKDLDTFWFSLKNWRDEDPESHFDDLGAWAEEKDGYASRIRRGKATNFSCDHVSCS